jgi:hypothetical protein
MPKTYRIGAFTVTSAKAIVTDPSYNEETASIGNLGCLLHPCATGTWTVEVVEDFSPEYEWEMVRSVTATLAEFSPSPADNWVRVEDSVGGDTGLLGLFDLAHFHDLSVIPANQEWTFKGGPAIPDELWFSYVCELVKGHEVAIVPFGFVVHWDGSMDVDRITRGNRIVAARLSVSGWPAGS